jgi:hypothetical protein
MFRSQGKAFRFQISWSISSSRLEAVSGQFAVDEIEMQRLGRRKHRKQQATVRSARVNEHRRENALATTMLGSLVRLYGEY